MIHVGGIVQLPYNTLWQHFEGAAAAYSIDHRVARYNSFRHQIDSKVKCQHQPRSVWNRSATNQN